MKIICIGSSAQDIFFPTSEGVILETPEEITSQRKIAFELGAKYQINDRIESLGGCAANVAVGLARLGMEVSCCTKIGNDNLGEWIKKELQREGVGIKYVQTGEGLKSDLSAIIVDEKSGERTIFFNRDSNEKLEVNPEDFNDAQWIFVSALNSTLSDGWDRKLQKIVDYCEKSGTKLALNPGQKNIKENCQRIIEVISKCEILMVNKDEALEIVSNSEDQIQSGELNDEKFLIEKLQKMGAKSITLTDGKRGAWIMDGEKLIHAKALVENPKDTTGSGDAFSSAFLAAYLKGREPEECLKWGIANGGNAVNFYGATEGLLGEEEMETKIKEVDIEA